MLPPAVQTVEEQLTRCYEQFSPTDTDIDRWVFLTQLHDSNEVLFYRLVGEHVTEMLPIVYTPTVGTAIEQFSQQFRRPRGVHLSVDNVDGIDAALESTGLGPDDVDLIVASDGEAILGIGDWGVGGIDISIGKLAVYTVAGGIDPDRVLAVGLDAGTNREAAADRPALPGRSALASPGRGVRELHRRLRPSGEQALPQRDPALGGLRGADGAGDPVALRRHSLHLRRRHPGDRLDRPGLRAGGGQGLGRAARRPADRRLRRRCGRCRHRGPARATP